MDEHQTLADQLLGDMTYDDPRKHNPAPAGPDPRLAGASVPVLDDMGAGSAPQPVQPRFQSLSAEQIATLQQQRAEKGLPAYTAEEIAELNADFIERQRIQMQQAAMQQQADAQAAADALLGAEQTYSAPEKPQQKEALPQVDASALLEEPAPEPEHKVVFNQEDLEAAKRKAVKSANASLTSAPKTEEDQARARRELQELRQQQQADLAQAGFKTSVILTVIGLVASFCMIWFAFRPFDDGFESNGFFDLCTNFYKAGGVLLVLLSVTIVTRVKQVKGLTSFLFGLSSVLLLVPGVVLLCQKTHAGAFPLTLILYLLAIAGCFAVTFVISTSDKLNAYYQRKEMMYD
ncbi:MAG: hypothetical protein II723_02130 [Oscillospiraceae bacterium]|nr:hypothetical protein [Oscillospiraceae bacterium]